MTDDLHQLPSRISAASLGRLQIRLRPMLRAAGGVSQTQQTATGGHAGSNNPLQFSAWPGSDFGVRAPYPSETPLSWDEVQHGRVCGVFEPSDGMKDDGSGYATDAKSMRVWGQIKTGVKTGAV